MLISLTKFLAQRGVEARAGGADLAWGSPPACRARSGRCAASARGGCRPLALGLPGAPVPGNVLLTDGVKLLLHNEVRWGGTESRAKRLAKRLAFGNLLLEPRLVQLSPLVRLGARLRVH